MTYYDRLKVFDWFYFCSDSHEVYMNGEAAKRELEQEAKTETEKEMFHAFAVEATKAWNEQRYAVFPQEKSA